MYNVVREEMIIKNAAFPVALCDIEIEFNVNVVVNVLWYLDGTIMSRAKH